MKCMQYWGVKGAKIMAWTLKKKIPSVAAHWKDESAFMVKKQHFTITPVQTKHEIKAFNVPLMRHCLVIAPFKAAGHQLSWGFFQLVITPTVWGHVLPLSPACDCRSILTTSTTTPAAIGTRRYCQKEAVTGMNRGTGSTSNIPNKGSYSLFIQVEQWNSGCFVPANNTAKCTHILKKIK